MSFPTNSNVVGLASQNHLFFRFFAERELVPHLGCERPGRLEPLLYSGQGILFRFWSV